MGAKSCAVENLGINIDFREGGSINGGEQMDLEFYKGKKVLVTGHTGFKGGWLCKILTMAGANVIGYSLAPEELSLYQLIGLDKNVCTKIGDIRNFNGLLKVFHIEEPEIVFHLAAQPLVRESYKEPVYTYETNVLGTVYVCECVRKSKTVKSFLNVTTDKVYKNNEWEWGYRENDPLDGFDPYSNSKSCSELVTHSYIGSFFKDMEIGVSTARAGNVIGGGDFAKDRIIPDCARAAMTDETIIIRNPFSIRPYQHVLEPLAVYLEIAQKQYVDNRYAGFYNVGPCEQDCITTRELVSLFCNFWGNGITWEEKAVEGPHEANFLKLDCSRVRHVFKWEPKWDIEKAVDRTVQWYKKYFEKEDINKCMEEQIREFLNLK